MILTISTADYRLIKDFDQQLCSGSCERIATGTRKLFLPGSPKGVTFRIYRSSGCVGGHTINMNFSMIAGQTLN